MSQLRERKHKDREYDIVVFGATSFAGALVTEYLLKHYNQSTLKWTIAGRSSSRLEDVKKRVRQYSVTADELRPIVADSSNKASLDAMTSKTRVIISTVGPFALYGSLLVQSCLENGTDYVDITGEPHWVRKMIDQHNQKAEENGTLFVNMSGFDSIPSDIGTLMVVDHLKKKGAIASEVKSFFVLRETKGGASGGTIASAIEAVESGGLGSMSNPHYLCPSPKSAAAAAPKSKDTLLPFYDDEEKSWTAPFMMAPVNRQVVRRTAALLGEEHGYSQKFQYTEVLSTPNVFVSGVVFVVMIVAGLLLSVSFSRNIIKKFVPAPGTGPTRKIIETGKWATHYIAKGRTPDGREVTVRGRAKGHQDPGYGDTARMLSESAVHLALSRDKCAKGGFRTPAAAYGPTFIDRLRTAGQDWIIE